LGKRNGRAVDADRLAPSQLLAQEMGDALKGWLSADAEQPFAEDARFKHGGAPQGQAQRGVLRYQHVKVPMLNDTDRAIRQSRYSDVIV
jgi:hypothetical protein